MFARRQAELKQRQLALRLRNLELRGQMQADAQQLLRPLGWLSLAGGALLFAGLRRPGRVAQALGLVKLGLRLARLLRNLSA